MPQEDNIKLELENKFALPEGTVKIVRPRRISLEVEYKNFPEVLDFILKQLGFGHLCTITGLDEGEKLGFIYHLAHDSGVLLNLKTSVPKQNPVLKTITNYFLGAEIYEREVVDLLGAQVEGLVPGNRYPLTDDWPKGEYPLRKDWKGIREEKENA